MKNQALSKANDVVKKMDAMKRAHEIEIRNIKKKNRKDALDFFKQKSYLCVEIFKQEQMYMVDQCLKMRTNWKKATNKLDKLRVISNK